MWDSANTHTYQNLGHHTTSSSSCSARYSNLYKEKVVSPPRCNFSRLKFAERSRLDDNIDRLLNDLRFVEEEDKSQKLDLKKIKKPSSSSSYTNSNLDGIIKGNVINTPFYSTSSQIPLTFYSTSSQVPQKGQISRQILIWDTFFLICMTHKLI